MMNLIDYSYLCIYTLLPASKRFKGLYVFLCTTIWLMLLLCPLVVFIGFYYRITGDITSLIQSSVYRNILKLSLAVLLVVYDGMTNKAYKYKSISRQELKANKSVKYISILWLITDIILFVFMCFYFFF